MKKIVVLFIIVLIVISWPSYFALRIIDNQAVYFAIIAFWFMPSPTYAVLILKFVLRQDVHFNLSFKHLNIKYLFLAPGLVLLYLLLTLGTVYLLGNILGIEAFGIISFEQDLIAASIEKLSGEPSSNNLNWYYLIPLIIVSGVLAGFSVNMLFAFTEELAWREFLLKELDNCNVFKANIIIGTIWGVWHTPIVLLGHNLYSYPLWGVILMVLFCIVSSFLLYFLRIRGKSVWIASIFHGSLNGTAGGILLFMHNGNMLFSNPVGVAGIIAIAILVIIIFATRLLSASDLVKINLLQSSKRSLV